MTVHFIGAGPGAADLITVRGRDLLARCPVCLYAGSIVPPELLAHCPAGARLVDTAPLRSTRSRRRCVGGARGGAGRGAAAFGRPLGLERGRRAGPPARRARHPLHPHAGRAGVRRRRGGARARADDPGGGAEPGADPRLRPRLGDAARRDAGGLRRHRRDARDPSRGARARAGGGRARRRSTAPTARWRSSPGRAGPRSGWCAARSATIARGGGGRSDRPDRDHLRRPGARGRGLSRERALRRGLPAPLPGAVGEPRGGRGAAGAGAAGASGRARSGSPAPGRAGSAA